MTPDTDFVVLETQPIRRMGGSLYFYLPHKWKQDYRGKLLLIDGVCQLQVQFLQAPGSDDIVMRIVETPKP
jgi:hypothetical protein